MPIYEFRCEACGSVFEHLAMTRGEEATIACPHCGGNQLTKLMSTTNPIVSSGSSTGPTVTNRSCPNAGNCTTITLPGYER